MFLITMHTHEIYNLLYIWYDLFDTDITIIMDKAYASFLGHMLMFTKLKQRNINT